MDKTKIGVVGAGSMGGGMVLLFAEKGNPVAFFDPSSENSSTLVNSAQKSKTVQANDVQHCADLKELAESMPAGQRVFVFSLPHGSVADKIIDELEPLVDPGDVIVDCANELWKRTHRRQERCASQNFGKGPIHYIGCGVSGGYQAARHGPSMSPGGTREAYDRVAPLLEKWAAKYKGEPCAAYMGKGGSGHLVKTLHNGIEQGILGAIAEMVALFHTGLGMSHGEIADVLQDETQNGGLEGNYLLDIGFRQARFTKADGVPQGKDVIDSIEDKVVQDADDTEGTGVWTMTEWAERHVAAPTLAVAHTERLISANKTERTRVAKLLNLSLEQRFGSTVDKNSFVQKARSALYAVVLASFVQGLNTIARANLDDNLDIPMANSIKIWRAGCIITSESITNLLMPIYEQEPQLTNLLLRAEVCNELRSRYQDLKDVVIKATEADCMIPTFSATLEYIKEVGSTHMPTNFEEAQMDFFGSHSYDVVGENRFDPIKGGHHTAWRPAAPTDPKDDA